MPVEKSPRSGLPTRTLIAVAALAGAATSLATAWLLRPGGQQRRFRGDLMRLVRLREAARKAAEREG